MGSFDCFCALCCGTLRGVDETGSSAPRALALRRGRVERKRRALLAGKEPPEDESDSDTKPSGNESEEDSDADGDEYAYDPELVDEESAEWLETVRGLGFNEETESAWVSGEGHYREQGSIYIPVGDDPELFGSGNDDDDDEEDEQWEELSGYNTYDAAFPFHTSCFKILTWVLTGDMDGYKKIDRNKLREAFATLERGTSLSVDYGPIEGGPAQFWECIPGEEYAVADPVDIPYLEDFLKVKLGQKAFQLSSTKSEIRPNVVADPFARLPYDVLRLVLGRLPGRSTLALATSSWTVQLATRNNSLWKEVIQLEMPWFPELSELLADERYSKTDYKRFYVWLEKELSVMYGLRGPLMGIANRKRIWEACEGVKLIYGYS